MLELKVGAAVLLASLILIFGVMWFQGFKFGEETAVYNVLFPQVGRLTKGDVVTMAGVKAGKVLKVELRDKDVLVVLAIDRQIRLRKDCEVRVSNVGIMGERFINIVQGKGEEVFQEGAYLPGIYDEGLTEIMGAAGAMLQDMAEITATFEELFDILQEDEALRTTIQRLAKLTVRTDSLLAAVGPEVKRAAGDFAQLGNDLKEVLRENREPLREGVTSFQEATAAFQRAGSKIDTLAARISVLADAIESEEGTLGRLIHDDTLIQDLEETLRDLNDIVEDVKADPKKYFKFSIF